ncbi:MAG: DEAD/DEAH box helicase family protein, partial [Acidobacteriota bacterium]
MSQPSELFAEIVLFGALDKTLHYLVPSHLHSTAQPGVRVLVPLGRRESTGLIVSLDNSRPDIDADFRPISAVLDTEPVVPPELLKLCRWIGDYYFHPLGEVIETALPGGMGDSPKAFLRLTEAGRNESKTDLSDLFGEKENISQEEAALRLGSPKRSAKVLNELEKRGLIERFFEWESPLPSPKTAKNVRLLQEPTPEDRSKNANLDALVTLLRDGGGETPLRTLRQAVKNADYWIKKLQKQGVIEIQAVEELREFNCAQTFHTTPPERLTPTQAEAMDTILPRIVDPAFETFLLHGVTGSGKTEIYLRLVDAALKRERGAIVLVPEIALSTQMEAVFRERFGCELAIWHSGLPPGARYDQWREVLSGRRRI